MKLCDRCRVPGCLLDYGGKACQEARKKYCPDVVFTHADKIREMEATVTLELTYIMIEVDGEQLIEIDKLNGVYKVKGVDMLAKVRSLI